jgi:hypothetical protein
MGDYNKMHRNLSNLNSPFTRRGRNLSVKGLGNCKVLRCQGDFADVKANGKIYLVDCNLRIVK